MIECLKHLIPSELAAVLSIFTSVSVKDEDSIVKVEHVESSRKGKKYYQENQESLQ